MGSALNRFPPGLRQAVWDWSNVVGAYAVRRKPFTVDGRKYWDQRASRWSREIEATAGDRYYARLETEFLATLGDVVGPGPILEVGCFAGYRLGRVAETFPGVVAVGLDVVPGALRLARQSTPASRPARLVNADATSLPFPAGSFECVYTFVCLTHVKERDVGFALDEILRVARTSVVLVEVYDQPMTWRKKLAGQKWTAGYLHAYERLLEERRMRPLGVQPCKDDTGHPRYTIFSYSKSHA